MARGTRFPPVGGGVLETYERSFKVEFISLIFLSSLSARPADGHSNLKQLLLHKK